MARFRGTLRGNRGMASRLGHAGLTGEVNGWRIGVRAYAQPGPNDTDEILVQVTGGSTGNVIERWVCVVRLGEGGIPTAYVNPGVNQRGPQEVNFKQARVLLAGDDEMER